MSFKLRFPKIDISAIISRFSRNYLNFSQKFKNIFVFDKLRTKERIKWFLNSRKDKYRVKLKKITLYDKWHNPVIRFWIKIKWGAKNLYAFMLNGFFILCLVYGWSIPHASIFHIFTKIFAIGAGFYFAVRNIRLFGIWLVKTMLDVKKIRYKDNTYWTEWQKYKTDELKRFGMEEKNVRSEG